MKHKDIKDEHLIFSNEYLKDFNATRSYKVAYGEHLSDNVAAASASALLRNPKVKSYIESRMLDRIERTEVTQDEVVMELANIIRANVTDVVNVRDGRIIIKDTEDLPKELTKTIKAIRPVRGGIEVEFYDKVKSLELLGRHLGMFDDRLTVEATQEDKVAEMLEGIANAVDKETS